MAAVTKKILCLALFTFTSLLPAAAQVSWGVRAGGAYSSIAYMVDGSPEAGARFGYSLAGISSIPVWREFSLCPEIAFVRQGGSFFHQPTEEAIPYEANYGYYSLMVPVNICYTFTFSDVGVHIFGGPVADFSLMGNKSINGADSKIKFGSGEGKDLKPFDLAVSIGLGVEYNNFVFSINGICGLLDRRALKHETEPRVYQNNSTLSLSYYFRPL